MSKFEFEINTNLIEVSKSIDKLEGDLRLKAAIPAVNKTAATVKTRIVRKIAKETGSRQSAIRAKIKLVKAHRGGAKSMRRLFAVVDANEAKAVNLIEFVSPAKRKVGHFNKRLKGKGGKRRYRSKGVVAKAWGNNKVYRGTFIGTNGAGQLRVYRRIGSYDKWGADQPITLVSGPSPAKEFAKPENWWFMQKVVNERFPIEYERSAKMVIARMKK